MAEGWGDVLYKNTKLTAKEEKKSITDN